MHGSDFASKFSNDYNIYNTQDEGISNFPNPITRESAVQLSLGSLFENQQSSFTLVTIYFHMFILGDF